jgi:hypothetical protein
LLQALDFLKANEEGFKLLLALIVPVIIAPREFVMSQVFVKPNASCAGLNQFHFTSLNLVFASII